MVNSKFIIATFLFTVGYSIYLEMGIKIKNKIT